MLSVLTYLTAPVSVCPSGPFEEYVRCGRMPQAKNHRHCKRIQMHIPQTCHSIPTLTFLLPLRFALPLRLVCPSLPLAGLFLFLFHLCLSLHLQLQLLTYLAQSQANYMILFLFMIVFFFLCFFFFLFWFWFCFFYICSNAPKLKVNSAVLLHHKLLYLPLPLPLPLPLTRGSNNCKQLNNAAKQTKINNNFNFSLSLLLLLLYSLRELFFMARVYLGLFVRCLCVCACVCVVKICFFFLYLKIGSIFVVCAFLARLQQVSGVWVRAWAWARALRPSLSDAAGLALR